MAILVKFSVSGATVEKYEEVLRRLEAAGAGTPPGQLYYVSYGSRENLQVIDVFDSQQSLDAFGKTLVRSSARWELRRNPRFRRCSAQPLKGAGR